MNTKSIRRNMTRNIRRATGLSLPLSAKYARAVDSGFIWDIASEHTQWADAHCDCCGPDQLGVSGPKGSITFSEVRRKCEPRNSPAPKGYVKGSIRTIFVSIARVDACLAAIRLSGAAAMILNGIPMARNTVEIAVNVSGRAARRALEVNGLVPTNSYLHSH